MKFKAWDGGKWRTDFVITPDENILTIISRGDDRYNLLYRPTWKVIRSTGLLDKNGIEIWEGDIVRCESVTGTPLYNSCTVYGKVEYSAPYWIIEGAYLWHELDDIEILGNVFENPELVEATP